MLEGKIIITNDDTIQIEAEDEETSMRILQKINDKQDQHFEAGKEAVYEDIFLKLKNFIGISNDY